MVALFHLLCGAARLADRAAEELGFDVLKAVFPLPIPRLDVQYDGLVKIPYSLPGETSDVVKNLETKEMPHFAFIDGQVQLQDVEVAQHEEIQGQVVVLNRHPVHTGKELLRGVERLLLVESETNAASD